MTSEAVKQATFVVCPFCDERKCVGRYNCKQISDYVKRKEQGDDRTIKEAKPEDAVRVVRCKDCKHWCTVDCATNYGSCSKLENRYKEDCESSFDETTRFDDFCSYGERKDND